MHAQFVRYGDWTFRDGEVLVGRRIFPVCLLHNPIFDRYLISRRTEGWLLTPVVYARSGHGRTVPDMPFYLLTNSPDAVNAEIESSLQCLRK